MNIKTSKDLLELSIGSPLRLVVVAAEDRDVLEAVSIARSRGVVDPVLTGNGKAIRSVAAEIGMDLNGVTLIETATTEEAVAKSYELVALGGGSAVMKGLVNSAIYLKALLDKRYGLRKGSLLSHVALMFPKHYHKPVLVTDPALNIKPNLDQKAGILNNAIGLLHQLGYEMPKVALLGHNEVPTDKVPDTLVALALRDLAKAGRFGPCIADGPVSLDVALSKEAADQKGISCPVAGESDLLLCPDILSANILYKSMIMLGEAHCAALIAGATVPAILTSRSDDTETKLLSIMLAAYVSGKRA